MVTIQPYAITDVLEEDIEWIREDGQIEMLFDMESLFVIPESPAPTVSLEPNNIVAIKSNGALVATVQAGNRDEAVMIRWTLHDMLTTCDTAR